MRKVLVMLLATSFAVLLILPGRANAIPSFARKYQTSCATCHIGFPKLNAFGRGFLVNGYQFPGGAEADKEQSKEKVVSMGAEAYKRVWPNAIWPNALPSSVPMSVIIETEIAYSSEVPEGQPKFTFANIPEEVEVLSGGNFSDNISYFAELAIEEGGIEVEMAHISFDNLLPNNGLSLKLGKIVPIVTPFSNMRRLTSKYWFAIKPLGDNQWNFDRTQRGLEARGLLSNGRVIYSAGLVEGRKNELNDAKDIYFHLGYKMGGLRLDGFREGQSTGSSNPWEDNSVRFDVFYYNGRATLTGGQKDNFSQVGGSVDFFWNRLNLSGLVTIQNDDRPVLGESYSGKGTNFMVEGTVVAYPWLLPTIRYERFQEKLGGISETDQRFVPAIIALIRANVKLVLSAEIEKEAGGDEWEVGETEFGLVFGF